MTPKHAIDISISKFSLTYKMLACIILVTLIIVALAIGVLYPVIAPLAKELKEVSILKSVGDAFGSLFQGDPTLQGERFMALKEAYIAFKDVFASATGAIWTAAAIIFVLYILYKYLLNTLIFSTADITNHFMNSGSKFGLISNIIVNLRRSSMYSLISGLIDAAFLALSLAIIYGVGWVLAKISIILMLPLVFVVIIVLASVKNSFFSLWLPTMIVGEKTAIKALKESIKTIFSHKNFLITLGAYIAYWFIGFSITLLLAIVTFGVALVVVPVFAILFSRAYNLVYYYSINNMKYYVDKQTVVQNNIKIDTLQ